MTDPRLLVPLEELPGFDATGIAVVRIHDSRNEHCIYDEGSEDTPEAFDGNLQTLGVDSDRARWQPRKLYAVSFADASARDRAARWLASRLPVAANPKTPLCTAPIWYCYLPWESAPLDYQGSYELEHPAWVDDVGFVKPVGNYSSAYGPIVPALADLDFTADERLPDGSRVVDAVALALVCQHVGRTT